MNTIPKGPSREETRAMDRILKEPSRQAEQPFFFFFPVFSFHWILKKYVGKDPVEGIWKPQCCC